MGFKEKVERQEQAWNGGDTLEKVESEVYYRVEKVAEERFAFLKLIDADGLLMALKSELILPEENPTIRKILRFVSGSKNKKSLFQQAWPSRKFNLTRKIETELNSKLTQKLNIDNLFNLEYNVNLKYNMLDENSVFVILEAMHTLTWEKDGSKHEVSIVGGGFLFHGIEDVLYTKNYGGLQWVMVESGYLHWFLHEEPYFDLQSIIKFHWRIRQPGELYWQDKIENILARAFLESKLDDDRQMPTIILYYIDNYKLWEMCREGIMRERELLQRPKTVVVPPIDLRPDVSGLLGRISERLGDIERRMPRLGS